MSKFLNLITYIDTSSNEQIIDLQTDTLPNTTPLRDSTGSFKVGNDSIYNGADVANKQYFNGVVDALDFSWSSDDEFITAITQQNGLITAVRSKGFAARGEVVLSSYEQTIDGVKTFKARAAITSSGEGISPTKVLRGTTWEIKESSITWPAEEMSFAINLTTFPPDSSDTSLSYCGITIQNGIIKYGGLGSESYSVVYWEGQYNPPWLQDFNRTILITGGQDANNAALINWLNDNATLISIENLDDYLVNREYIDRKLGFLSVDSTTTSSHDDVGDFVRYAKDYAVSSSEAVLSASYLKLGATGEAQTVSQSVTFADDCQFTNSNKFKRVLITNQGTSNNDVITRGFFNDVETNKNSLLLAKFNVISPNTQISLQNLTNVNRINWGDGVESNTPPPSLSHTYVQSGRYYGMFYDVTSIGYRAFHGCNSLTSITIPDSVTSIGDGAFAYCSGLTSVTIGNGVETIGNSAFYYCSSLTSVNIPSGVTGIGDSAFYYCSSLTSVNIPSGVTSIESSAFAYCSALTSVTIGNGVETIGEGAFSGCSHLTSITIPDSVVSIERIAFANCSGLTSVTIGNGVTAMGNYAFLNCSALTSISFGGTMAQWNTAITGSPNWKYSSAIISVVCSDGTINY